MTEQAPQTNHTDDYLRIWQQNVNGSSNSQLDLIHSTHTKHNDILAIQEPYINFLGLAQATPSWTVVYPHGHQDDPQKTRATILINRTTLSSNAWTQIDIPSPDIVAIQSVSLQGTLRLFNIYNDCNHDNSQLALQEYMRRVPALGNLPGPIRYVWLGDFNRHSPIWDEARNHHLFTSENLRAAGQLIQLYTEYNLVMTLPPGVATLEALATKNRTRVDNVFCDAGTLQLVDMCTTREDWRPVKTDHFPIITHLRLFAERKGTQPRHNFRKVDWEELKDDLKKRLDALPKPRRIQSVVEAEGKLAQLEAMVADVIDLYVHVIRAHPRAKRWWTKELTAKRWEVQTAARRAREVWGIEGHPDIECYRRCRNDFAQNIKDAKDKHWNQWLAEMDGSTIWDTHRLVNSPPSDGGAARVPVLQTRDPVSQETMEVAVSNDDKARMLYQLFFPGKPLASSVPTDYEYPEPKWEYAPVTNALIHKAIQSLRPFKASKPGSIPNSILINAADMLVPHIGPIFRATDELQWYPQHWKVTQTPVIRKPGWHLIQNRAAPLPGPQHGRPGISSSYG